MYAWRFIFQKHADVRGGSIIARVMYDLATFTCIQIVLFDRINCYETLPSLSVCVSILICETIPACTCSARIVVRV